jgi:hypothetical protein
MLRAGPDEDDTIRVKRPAAKRGVPKGLIFAGVAALVVLAGGAGAAYMMLRTPVMPIDTETEAQIDATRPCAIKISRFADDPAVVVVDFPDLTTQGLTLNRVAALVEKAGLPRGRVLNDVQLNQAIYSCGETIESYYYGHDYKAADLARFFNLAAADGVKLNPHELWLKQLVRQLGWLQPGANGALITLPAASPPITQEMRAVILHHELSHGGFYTIPADQKYAETFWANLTPQDRAAFTGFLGRQGYDTTNTELMLNETQAYLIFTRDPLFFNAAAVGMSTAQVDTLRAGYIANIPTPWLQTMANAALPLATAAPACGA